MVLRTLIQTPPPHSVEAITRAFLSSVGVTEQKVRELAYTKRITLSAAVRGLMCHKYPQLREHWPLSKLTEAQLAGIAKRSRSPDGSDMRRSLDIIAGLVENPHDGKRRRYAVDFLRKHGRDVEDPRMAEYNRHKEIDNDD